MRLATPDAVLTVLGIQTSSGSLAAAGAALDATYPVIESSLDTTLLRSRRTDYFDLTSADRVAPSLRLSCSFVSKEEEIVIEYSNDGVPLSAINRAVLDPQYYHIDYTLGVVYIGTSVPVCRRSIAVTFSAGFEADLSNPTQLGELPDAITQAGLSKAASYMLLNPANVAKDKARFTAEVAVQGMELASRNAMSVYQRPRGTVVWHSHSEILE